MALRKTEVRGKVRSRGNGVGKRKKRERTRQGQRLCETGSVLDPRGGLQNDRPQHSTEWEVRRCDGPVSLPARGVGAVGVVVECGGGVVWCCGPDLAVYVVRGRAGSRSDAVEREYECRGRWEMVRRKTRSRIERTQSELKENVAGRGGRSRNRTGSRIEIEM